MLTHRSIFSQTKMQATCCQLWEDRLLCFQMWECPTLMSPECDTCLTFKDVVLWVFRVKQLLFNTHIYAQILSFHISKLQHISVIYRTFFPQVYNKVTAIVIHWRPYWVGLNDWNSFSCLTLMICLLSSVCV